MLCLLGLLLVACGVLGILRPDVTASWVGIHMGLGVIFSGMEMLALGIIPEY